MANQLKKLTKIEKIKKSLQLTTFKIVLIAILLSLTTLISLFEIPLPFFLSFLKLDFGNSIILLSIYLIGFFYTALIAVICPWLRLILPHTGPGDVIGELSYMLASLTILVCYCLINYLLNKLLKPDKSPKYYWFIEVVSAILACSITSFLNVFYNWLFLLDLYQAGNLKVFLLTVFLPYNLFKFSLILFLFLLLKKPTLVLNNIFVSNR